MRNLLVFIVCILSLSLISCGNKIKPGPPVLYPPGQYESGEDDAANNEPVQPGSAVSENNRGIPSSLNEVVARELQEVWSYAPQNITISPQTTIQQAVLDVYPYMERCYDYDNVGGAKLLGEMSADKYGYNNSYYDYSISIDILSLPDLRFRFISSNSNVISRVISGVIDIPYAKIMSVGFLGLSLDITVRNVSNEEQDVSFEQGQMIEVVNPHVQNVVLTSSRSVTLRPQESQQLSIPAYCAAHYRATPSGSYARVTPYVLDVASTSFQSQQQIWNVLEERVDPNDYITFYIWKSGTIMPSGNPSRFGHAFVRIPKVGAVGFGPLHGGLFDDDGNISDHTSSMILATDSCRIRVSKDAKRLIEQKLRELQANVPKYRVGNYDCVSFVMDLADAGDINYGNRFMIQKPETFMKELKKHNYVE